MNDSTTITWKKLYADHDNQNISSAAPIPISMGLSSLNSNGIQKRRRSSINSLYSPFTRRRSFLSRNMIENESLQCYKLSSYSSSYNYINHNDRNNENIPSFSISLSESQGFIWNQDLFASEYQQSENGLGSYMSMSNGSYFGINNTNNANYNNSSSNDSNINSFVNVIDILIENDDYNSDVDVVTEIVKVDNYDDEDDENDEDDGDDEMVEVNIVNSSRTAIENSDHSDKLQGSLNKFEYIDHDNRNNENNSIAYNDDEDDDDIFVADL